MKKYRHNPAASWARSVVAVIAVSLSLGATMFSQDDPTDAAPPPIKIVSKNERDQLGAKTDVKDRTKLSVELMKTRVMSAEKLATMRNFEGMYNELGHFHGLMDDALDHLARRDDGGGKIMDNFKRLELALRSFAPKLETMRRELPLRYDPYVRRLLTFLRDARAKATDSLFSDTVLPGKRPGN